MKSALAAVTAALALCTTLLAQPAPKPAAPAGAPRPPMSKPVRVMDAAARSNMLAKTGGTVYATGAGPSVLFLNVQTRVAASLIQETPDQIQKILRLPAQVVSRPSSEPVTEALKALADPRTAVVIVIADTPGYPALLVAPENRWVVVNVAALGGADVPAETLASRVQKELWRAFGYVMGAAHSTYEHCVLKPVLKPEDLDELKPKTLCPEPLNKIMTFSQKLGVPPVRMGTYRKAVEEGWAPAPTNDIQRAIWQELGKKPQ